MTKGIALVADADKDTVRFGEVHYTIKLRAQYRNDTLFQMESLGSEGWYSNELDDVLFMETHGIRRTTMLKDSSGTFCLDGAKLEVLERRNHSVFCRRGNDYLLFSLSGS